MHVIRGTLAALLLVPLSAPLTNPAALAQPSATEPAAAPAAPPLSVDLGAGVRLELVPLPAGTFTQGSPVTEAGRSDDEAQRPVTLTKPFYVGRSAVTRAQWERFAADTGYRTEAEVGTSGGYGWDGKGLSQRKAFTWRTPGFPQAGDHPVCLVTYPDAEAFCRWLSKKAGRAVALPTEAQWEYACRAGTTSAWHNGSSDASAAGEVAWARPAAGDATHPVAGLKPNAWGLFVGGNVSEWCQDWYGPYPAGPATDPVQATPPAGDKPRRVLRGGSWNRDVKHTRSAARFRSDARSRNADIGFRVVAAADAAPVGSGPSAGVDSGVTDAAAAVGPGPGGEAHPRGAGADHAPADASAAEPVRGQPSAGDGSDGGVPGWAAALCGLTGFSALIYLVVRVLRGLGGSAGSTAMPGAAAMRSGGGSGGGRGGVRLGPDGFWLNLPGVAPGSRVHYTYRAAGIAAASDAVEYRPGPEGHFVYTGRPPQSASVLNVEPPAGGVGDVMADRLAGGPGFDDTSAATGFGTGLGMGTASSRGSRPPMSSSRPFRSSSSSHSSSSHSSSHRPSAY